MSPSSSIGSSLGWSYAMDGGRQALTAVIMLVLAAILGPEAFGVLAMALVYVMFVELLVKQGLASAIIQRKDLRPAHLDSAFWGVLGVAVLLFAVSIALAGWWAEVNATPSLRWVIIGLTPMILIQALTVVQEALMRRSLRFKSLALRTNAAALAGGVVGIGMALGGAGVWALVGQQLATAATGLVVLWAASSWRPGLRFSGRAARDLLGFSSGSFLTSLGVFVQNRGDALVIGLIFGPVVVGLYRMAYRLVDTIVGISVRAITSISLPQLAPVQDEPGAFRARALTLLWLSALVGLPALGVLFALADPLLLLLGEEWRPAATALRILVVAGGVHALFVVTGPILQALGRPHLGATLSWLSGGLGVAGLLLAGVVTANANVTWQLTALAGSRAAVYGLALAGLSLVILRVFASVPPSAVMRAARPAVAAGVAAAAVGSWIAVILTDRVPSPLVAIVIVAAAAVTAGGVVLLGFDARLRRRVRAIATDLPLRALLGRRSGPDAQTETRSPSDVGEGFPQY